MVRTAGSSTVAPPQVASPIAVPANSLVHNFRPDPTAEPSAPAAAATAPLDSHLTAAPLSWSGLRTQVRKLHDALITASGIDPDHADKPGAFHPLPGVIQAVRQLHHAEAALEHPPDITLERLAEPPVPGMEPQHAKGLALVTKVVETAALGAEIAMSPRLEQRDSLRRRAGEVLLTAAAIVGLTLLTPLALTAVAAVGMVKGLCLGDSAALRPEKAGERQDRGGLEGLAKDLTRDIGDPAGTLTCEHYRNRIRDLRSEWNKATLNIDEPKRSAVTAALDDLEKRLAALPGESVPAAGADGGAELIGLMAHTAAEIAEIAVRARQPEGLLRACGRLFLDLIRPVGSMVSAAVPVPLAACFHAAWTAARDIQAGALGAFRSIRALAQDLSRRTRASREGVSPGAGDTERQPAPEDRERIDPAGSGRRQPDGPRPRGQDRGDESRGRGRGGQDRGVRRGHQAPQ